MNDSTGRIRAWRHPVNVGHLVMGIAFLAIVGAWALIQNDVVTGEQIRWLLPVPWVLGGLGGLLAIALAGRRRRTRQTGWVESEAADDATTDTDIDTDPEPDTTRLEEDPR